MLRAVGVGLAGVGLMASGAKAIDDPTLANNLRVLSDAAGLVWRGAEIGVGTGVLKAESKLGWLGGSTFSKITGVMGATVDAIAAYDAFSKGDNVSGGLYVAQGTGMMMATFGASAASASRDRRAMAVSSSPCPASAASASWCGSLPASRMRTRVFRGTSWPA